METGRCVGRESGLVVGIELELTLVPCPDMGQSP